MSTAVLSPEQRKLLDDKNFAHVATKNADGTIQVNPVWIEYDGTHVVFNSEDKRAKVKNLRRDPRVTLCVLDSANPYRYVEIRGVTTEITTEGADETINRLAKKYMDKDEYPFNRPGDVRVVIRVLPEKITAMGF